MSTWETLTGAPGRAASNVPLCNAIAQDNANMVQTEFIL